MKEQDRLLIEAILHQLTKLNRTDEEIVKLLQEIKEKLTLTEYERGTDKG